MKRESTLAAGIPFHGHGRRRAWRATVYSAAHHR